MTAPAAAFNAFNAKYLTPEEIAESFIPPPQYDTLTDSGHTMLIGPRGAGKTTLLAMLGTRALAAWRHERAKEIRAKVGFTGVHICTDLTWRGHIDATTPPMADTKTLSGVGLIAFTTHVLHAVATAAHERVHGPFDHDSFAFRRATAITEADESRIASETAAAWGVEGTVGSFRALQEAMTDRSSDIAGWLEGVREATLVGIAPPEAPKIKSLSYASAALSLIERFNSAAGEPDARWALMFDELELAPETIRSTLVRSMRGGNKLLLYKLSLAPHSDHGPKLQSVLAASAGNDYRSTYLSYPAKTRGYDFCRDLLAAKLNVQRAALDEQAVFGLSPFDTTAEAWTEAGTAYSFDSPKLRRLKRQVEADGAFREWLDRKEIDLDNPDFEDGDDRAAKLRKLSAIALVRGEFRTGDDQRERHRREERARSKATAAPLYAGATSLYAMVEGNPRWFMNLVDPLIDLYKRKPGIVPANAQADAIARTNRRFRAVLKALPLPPREWHTKPQGILPVLDAIGDYFYDQLVLQPFNADPPGSFVVDRRVSEQVHWELTVALNAGAIIHLPDEDDEDEPLQSLRGHRFRLAHLLAPGYRITLNAGRALNVSTILERVAETRPNQLRIEFEAEETSET